MMQLSRSCHGAGPCTIAGMAEPGFCKCKADAERIAELEAALEPFAAFYARVDLPQFRSDDAIAVEAKGDIGIRVGAFRKAWEVAASPQPVRADSA